MNPVDPVVGLLTPASVLLLAVAMLQLCRKFRTPGVNEKPSSRVPNQQQLALEVTGEKKAELPCLTSDEQTLAVPVVRGNVDGDPGDHGKQPTRFVIDSIVLLESFRYVCKHDRGSNGGFREVFHYATGVQVDQNTFVIGHIVPVTFSRQSAGGVRVADDSNIRALESLDRLGMPLLAHFHSHPGHGVQANHPSSVDRAFQERLERGGHIAIGGIFSRDGFVRFFAGDPARFAVEVQGNHFRKVEDHVYQLSVVDCQLPIGASSRSG